jgi:hypothetical protein
MIVAFSNETLRQIASSKEDCEGAYGEAVAADVVATLAELEAAESMEDLIKIMIWQVVDKEHGQAMMRGQSGVVIRIVENHVRPNAVRRGDAVDWSFVRRVKITSIEVKE